MAWCNNLRSTQDWQLWAKGQLDLQDEPDLPALKQIPAMQRRRLSAFAKLSFHCVLDVLEGEEADMPCVFSSRHGDLHKTSKLIENVAEREDLSPTHFGLSVHNAVAGLYSIFSGNKQAMTATAAGEDTLFMAMVDAYAKLESQNLDKILLVYTDQVVPEKYQPYVSNEEETISIAMVLEKSTTVKSSANTKLTIDFEKQATKKNQENTNNGQVFQPLAFMRFLFDDNKTTEINSSRYLWRLSESA